jgi:hypothetical protein
MKFFLAVTLIAMASPLAMAHEGHDKSPGMVAAPHGGIIKAAGSIYLELVSNKDGVKIYPVDHDMKAVAVTVIQLDGKVLFPKKIKPEAVQFTTEGDAFTAKINAKGSHRYTLNLDVTANGKKESLKFNVEP